MAMRSKRADLPTPDEQSARELERLAHWLDTLFQVPGLRVRFGIDALLGLLSGVGDTASALAAIYILRAAAKLGVSRAMLARMTLNILIDLLIGTIPIIGDLFDVYWKANQRNVNLVRRHLQATPATQRRLNWSDRLFVAAMIALITAVLIASVVGAYFLVVWIFSLLRGNRGM
jgi:nitrate reductase NapE component